MTRTIATVLAACTLAAAGAASAQEARIAYGDLDLATTAGAATFDARVQKAARSFCRESRGATSRISDRTACERAVREEAMAQLPEYAQVRYAVSRLPVVA
ncbi:UrcA family protein [Brevundimonas sp.]|uniref:UrcA family protein n=1 Tax=Brevundimonas sp. TaxID=1871086 RepID=UPI001A2EF6CA|nr:UrcA family protein [Brevundimonas sp.]MBJ7484673.1 UrcA family protein [Brevundimonas sp.]